MEVVYGGKVEQEINYLQVDYRQPLFNGYVDFLTRSVSTTSSLSLDPQPAANP
jgi:hypothetical protein